VLIQEGIERIVPLKATDRSPEPIQEFPLPIDLSSVKQLGEVFRRILRIHSVEKPTEEQEDGDIQAIHIFSEGDGHSHRATTTTSQGDLAIAQQCTTTDALSYDSPGMPQHRYVHSSQRGIGEES
jgi:hypothetical protein